MKKLLSVIIVLSLLVSCFSISAFAASAKSGTVGQCRWSLSGTTLTISGKGSTGDVYEAPWTKNITRVVVEEGVTEIGTMIFSDCASLHSVKLPSTLRTIGQSAFSGCQSLASLNIPEKVITIGGWAFRSCYSLASINVDPDNKAYRSIDGVLYNKSMTKLIKYPQRKSDLSFTVPKTVTIIESDAFENAPLTSISMPENLTEIGLNAFFNSTLSKQTDNRYQGALYLGDYLIQSTNKNIKSFSVREGTKLIASGAFTSCPNLSEIYIPEGVTGIGEYAFAWCEKLTDIYLPKSVKRVEDGAFCDCKSLKNVYYMGKNTDRSQIYMGEDNTYLRNANWKYDCCLRSVDHDWIENKNVSASCSAEGYAEKTCQVCGRVESEVFPKLEHNYSEYETVEKATLKKTGLRLRTCYDCDYIDTEEIPVIERGAYFYMGIFGSVILFVLLAGVISVIVIGIVMSRKKRKG